MIEIPKEYTEEDIIELLSYMDIEKRIMILKKCPYTDVLTDMINKIYSGLNLICDSFSSIVSDDIMMLILGQFYLKFARNSTDVEIEIDSNIIPKDFNEITTNQAGCRGFYIDENTFIRII